MIKRDLGGIQSYLTQISQIPLLTRGEEIALAERLDEARRRLYRGILGTGHGLQMIVTLLHSICEGVLRVDHVLELPKPGVSEKHRMLEYLRPTLRTLRSMISENQTDFVLARQKGQPVRCRRSASRRLLARVRQGFSPPGRDNHPQAIPAADPE